MEFSKIKVLTNKFVKTMIIFSNKSKQKYKWFLYRISHFSSKQNNLEICAVWFWKEKALL